MCERTSAISSAGESEEVPEPDSAERPQSGRPKSAGYRGTDALERGRLLPIRLIAMAWSRFGRETPGHQTGSPGLRWAA